MANVLMRENRTEDVVTLCKRTLSLDPRNSQAYALLGEVYIDRRQPELALPHLEKAVEIQPKITQNRVSICEGRRWLPSVRSTRTRPETW